MEEETRQDFLLKTINMLKNMFEQYGMREISTVASVVVPLLKILVEVEQERINDRIEDRIKEK